MKMHALVLAVCLAACGQPTEKTRTPPATPDPFELNIEIGRYGAMLGSVGDLTRERPGADPEVTEPRDLARRLRETVWEYNLQRSQLCAKGLYTEITCGPAYAPVWIAEPETTEPSLEDLQTRANAVGDEVRRLWDTVCEDARSRVEGEQERMQVCAME
jgi:hypothetical protein